MPFEIDMMVLSDKLRTMHELYTFIIYRHTKFDHTYKQANGYKE